MSDVTTIPTLNRKDFVTDQTVRWCPGCGDYSILAQMQKVLPEIGVPKEKIVFISGIGCSSRFPYYMNTYGIHSIHGRAPTLATGLAVANPDLSIWVITGDGDGLSIGGNHLLHVIRRNVNLNIILFNNRIYGLTKGQYSPTSRKGTRTKSSPMGSIEQPLNPIALALAAKATFVARSIDAHTQHLGEILYQAAMHRGTSFVEVYQNCVIFNPNEWQGLDDRRIRDEHIIYLEDGKPMVFGKERDKGVRLDGYRPEIVQLGNGTGEDDLIVHDVSRLELATLLSGMEHPESPVPMGVIRQVESPTYYEGLGGQVQAAIKSKGVGDLATLYNAADTWTVTAKEQVTSKATGELSLELSDEYVDEIDKPAEPSDVIQNVITAVPVSALGPHAPITVEESTSVAKAIRLMNKHSIGCVLITDKDDKLTGIFTERDVLMRIAGLAEDLSQEQVSDYMTPSPVSLAPELPIAHALNLMSESGFRHLPLVDKENRPEGVISFRDVLRYLKRSIG
jgi:2-oxoglutarate ferredoxin oxidoreductase subunit beta